MPREPEIKRKTAISYKTEKKTVLRGYNVSDLAEAGYTFCDAMFILFQDRMPTGNESKMLKYEMGEFMGALDVALGGLGHRRDRRPAQPALRGWRRP